MTQEETIKLINFANRHRLPIICKTHDRLEEILKISGKYGIGYPITLRENADNIAASMQLKGIKEWVRDSFPPLVSSSPSSEAPSSSEIPTEATNSLKDSVTSHYVGKGMNQNETIELIQFANLHGLPIVCRTDERVQEIFDLAGRFGIKYPSLMTEEVVAIMSFRREKRYVKDSYPPHISSFGNWVEEDLPSNVGEENSSSLTSHYNFDYIVRLTPENIATEQVTIRLDPYRIEQIYGGMHPAQFHAVKKLLVPGNRGKKPLLQDIEEAIESLERWKSMLAEDQNNRGEGTITRAAPEKVTQVEPKQGYHSEESLANWLDKEI